MKPVGSLLLLSIAAAVATGPEAPALRAAPQQKPLRIIAFGAHPDDAELKASGVAALWAAAGAQGEVRRDDQRRRRPLRDGRRPAGPAAQGGSRPSARASSASRPRCSTSTTAS